eukprot:TRINITY_DN24214_c0_g1_i1.p1 TRINITY_DN24214_c0_g1~~TRINITY_DN24214_c0_g1_i1.p1  ORF type:complete len:400 (+),score=106.74 TRINITY_DN24214_c0_g1_i1:62-1201(+)
MAEAGALVPRPPPSSGAERARSAGLRRGCAPDASPVRVRRVPLAQRTEVLLTDLLHSRITQLRNLFRSLDVDHAGRIPVRRFEEGVADFFHLQSDPESVRALQRILSAADPGGSGKLSFRDFYGVLRGAAAALAPEDAELERERFGRPGLMDKKLFALLANAQVLDVGVLTRRPCNEIGSAWTSPPYAVLGDAERMAAMETGYISSRTARLKSFFAGADRDGNGRLSHQEFRAGLRRLCPQASRLQVEELVRALDEHGRGYIELNDFLTRFSLDFLNKPSQQGSPGSTNILYWPASVKRDRTQPEPLSRRLRHAVAPRCHTRAEALRFAETQRQLRGTDPARAERMRIPPMTARGADGELISPRAKQQQGASVTLPKVR